ncbi:mRNA capping enzyme, alpha subunit [Mytilinidion resinicola]|uniref:mRNA-capping enzyme subunit alpha n=1 Tax=Mytilinidion resinicola TaxID=574789 RepID=A0A6A6Y4R1_9PEZI|nr:mRNA capping enzyme, alpha subunit [Mytilinidion resinicola]KAF2803508.1 mRNA capping enzyme, alpha subunit [Mytilinidion resinicola]
MPPHSVPPGIPGSKMPRDVERDLRGAVAGLLERDTDHFPGAQPISFAREHIHELQRSEYFMCEKTDGIRCLLYLTYSHNEDGSFRPDHFLIDRKNNFYLVPPGLHFPHISNPHDENIFTFGTLLDGELVHDFLPNNPRPRLIFYIFDCLAVGDENVTKKPLDKRLGKLHENIFKPLNIWRQQNPKMQEREPFRVKLKEVHSPYHISDMFRHVLPSLPHGNDGLIFTCKSTPYKFGTDKHILKWKPPQENTIDFKLRLGEFPTFDPQDGEEGEIPDFDAMPDRFILLVQHNNNQYKPFQHDLYIEEADWEILKALGQPLDGRIIECYRDPSGRWRYKREDDGTPRWRDDKKDANHISTVNGVLESIEDPVTEEDLIAAEGRIKEAVHALRARDRRRREVEVRGDAEQEAKKRKLSNGID